ncbi:hypothetical protein ABMA27_001181 [Loxostege sticticalis]|uniref:Reverse transcriptase domain-containing protein n=1 Tax=Loxostege sticticalis TaxID=481309 RepID=A0ABR3HXT8_LOXSC
MKYRYRKGNYDLINKRIAEVDWITEFSSRSLEECVTFFYSTLEKLKKDYIPSVSVKDNHQPKWYSPSLLKMIKEKRKYFQKYKTYKNRCDLESYNILRLRIKDFELACYQKYIASVEDSIESNPRHFWSYVQSRRVSGAIPSSMRYGATVVNSGESICDAFSSYFQSTFLNSSANQPSLSVEPTLLDGISDLSSIEVDSCTIRQLLSKLDPAKSAGPDHLPAYFLIQCADSLTFPISLLFKRSLLESYVPKLWKLAFITPVHKSGSKIDIDNYRPISKLCIISKVFEKIVYDQLYNTVKNSFSDYQHGFLRKRSTVSNLVLLNDYVTHSMDNGRQVDVIYTDYSKAFDRIDHNLLLGKLQDIGIRGDLLRWFSSYISNRSQAVVIKNYISGWVSIPSGVPQGSLLGPLLFVIFVNDISSCLHSSRLLCFADDMKIYTSISSQDDAVALQADLSRLCDYCVSNKLDLNPSKCSVVTFGRKRDTKLYTYSMKGQDLPRKTSVRDLGVIHDSKLIFEDHINSIVAKASRALGFVMRNSVSFNKVKTLKILYCTFVRSHLEYASQIWNPRYQTYIARLERIQEKFIKYLCFRTRVSYSSVNYLNLCRKHHLLPLVNRREIADFIYLLKIVTAQIDCPHLLAKINLNVPRKILRRNTLLYLPKVNSNYRQNSFLWRASSKLNKIIDDSGIDIFHTTITAARRQLGRRFFESA